MVPLSLISLPFFLLPWFSLAEDPVHIELQRRNKLQMRGIDYGNEAERVRYRYGFGASPSAGRRKRATGSIPIINQHSDSSYLATVNIGTPPQPLSVVLDTGSTDLWVATSCRSCTNGTKLFIPANSSTFKTSTSQVTISYGSGKVGGTVGEDTVSMGGFTVAHQTLLAVTQLSDKLIEGEVSGIMGLAWRRLASTNAEPFWSNLANNDSLTTTDMSFWLRRETDPSADQLTNGGVFTLGGINDTLHTGNIEFIPMPVQPPSFWLLGLSSLTANGSPIKVKTGTLALSAIDTGTTLIGGPSEDVANFWAAIPGSAASTSSDGFYTFPCKTKITVTMAFGGKSWTINTADMNLGEDQPGRCLGAIFDLSLGSSIPPGGDNPSWVVGATFLKNVYTVFRASPPSIGFAQLSSAAGGGSGTGVVDSSTVTFTKTRSGPASVNTEPTGGTSSSTMLAAPMIGLMIALVLGLFNML